MERNPARTATSEDRRSPFDRFVEWVHLRASKAPFFFVCAGIVVVWLVSVPLWTDLKAWQTAIHTVASVFTLLLVVLIENAGRRAEETSQEKLNAIAAAMVALMASSAQDNPELQAAITTAREAIGLEERH